MEKRKTAQFANTIIDAITYHEMLEIVDFWLKDKSTRSHHIATINAYCVYSALRDERLSNIYSTADIAGPDGEMFVKWMRKVKRQKVDKICARDTILTLIEHSKKANYSFFLYGGHPEILEKMVENFKTKFPHINIVGLYSPPFRQLTKEEDEAKVIEINNLKPDIILVGLGTPKQDYWIDEHIERIKGSVMVTCGATFDFFGGRVRMAPPWIQKSGFEWLFRLMGSDFKRLWKRYTFGNLYFLFYFFLVILGIKKYTTKRSIR